MFAHLPIWMQYCSVLSFVFLYTYISITCPTAGWLALGMAVLFTGATGAAIYLKWDANVVRWVSLCLVIGLGLLTLFLGFLLLIPYGGLFIPVVEVIACPLSVISLVGVYLFFLRPTPVAWWWVLTAALLAVWLGRDTTIFDVGGEDGMHYLLTGLGASFILFFVALGKQVSWYISMAMLVLFLYVNKEAWLR